MVKAPPAAAKSSSGGTAPVDPAMEVKRLGGEVERLQGEVKQFKELAARAQADLQNARARMGKEAEEMRVFAAELILRQLLPTIDNLRRACQHLPKDLASHELACHELVEWVKGVLSTEQELLRQLKSIGLEPINAVGQPVDPLQHEALLTGPGEEGVVLDVLEEGYTFRGRVLRPAKVQVGKAEAVSQENSGASQHEEDAHGIESKAEEGEGTAPDVRDTA